MRVLQPQQRAPCLAVRSSYLQQSRRQCLANAKLIRVWLPKWCIALHISCCAMQYCVGMTPTARWLLLPGVGLLADWCLRLAVW